MSCSTLELFKGERRVVSVEFSTCDDAPFTIRNASYQLEYGNEVEVAGEPIVEEHQLTLTIAPKRVGRPVSRCQIEVADELIIRRIPVFVRE